MNLTDYQHRLARLMSSDADVDTKEKAIANLRKIFEPSDTLNTAKQQFRESQADISDIGGTFE